MARKCSGSTDARGAAGASPEGAREHPDFVSAGKDGGWRIQVLARPGSGRDALEEVVEGRLKVKLRAQAQDNQANEGLIAFLAKLLGLPKTALELAAGHTARKKTIRIRPGFSPDWSKVAMDRQQ